MWLEYLPELAQDALAAGIPRDGGILDVSGFLRERQAQSLAGRATMPPAQTLSLTLADPCAFIRGDANRDGIVDLADALFISN